MKSSSVINYEISGYLKKLSGNELVLTEKVSFWSWNKEEFLDDAHFFTERMSRYCEAFSLRVVTESTIEEFTKNV